MKKSLTLAASVAPSLLLALVYIGDTFLESLITMGIFLGLMVVLTAAAFWGEAPDPPVAPWGGRFFARGPLTWWIRAAGLVGLGLLFLLLSDRPYQHMVIFPAQTTGLRFAAAVAIALLGLLVVKPPKPWVSLLVLLLAGLAIRALWFSVWEINPARRDMLALVISAIERFLSLENPYGFHQMQLGSEVPLTYPPGLWLLHLPAFVAGLDIRWTAWLSDDVIVLCLGGYALRARSSTSGPVFVALATYLFLPDIHWNGIYAEPHADWAVLVAFVSAALSRRPLLTGALFGLALTTRPFNIVLLPFFAIWLFRQFGLRRARLAVLIAGAIAAAIYLPFVLWDPDAFFSGTVRWLLEYGPAHRTWFHGKMSFTGILYLAHLERLMAPAQLAALVIAFGLALWRLRTTRHLVAFSMAMYALFVSFNAIVWMSFWIGPCLLAIALAAASGDPVSAKIPSRAAIPAAPPTLRRLIAEVGLAGAVLVALAVMLLRLRQHFDDTGLEAARAFVADELEPDDFIVDDTGYRKGILKTPHLLSSDDLPPQAELGETLFQAELPRRRFLEPWTKRRLLVVERYHLFENREAVLLGTGPGKGPFSREYTRRFENYNIYLFKRRDTGALPHRLSETPADLSVRAISKDRSAEGTLRDGKWIFRGISGGRAGIQPCRVEGSSTDMISATPRAGVRYALAAEVRAPKWITLFGGFPERTTAWHRGPVRLTVTSDSGAPLGELTCPNLSGMRGVTLGLPRDVRRFTISLETEAPENPRFCFDAVLWEIR